MKNQITVLLQRLSLPLQNAKYWQRMSRCRNGEISKAAERCDQVGA